MTFLDFYFSGVGLTAMWMLADDFHRLGAGTAKYRLVNYFTRPFLFPYFLVKFLFSRAE